MILSFSRVSMTIVLGCLFTGIWGQSPNILRQSIHYHTLDRADILRFSDTTINNTISVIPAAESCNFISQGWNNDRLSDLDRYDFDHLLADYLQHFPIVQKDSLNDSENFWSEDNPDMLGTPLNKTRYYRKPVLTYFYQTKPDFLTIRTPYFQAYINPILRLQYDNQVNNANTIFQNTRGIDIKAYIDKKVYIYSQLLETQMSFPDYVEARIQKYSTVPGQGAWKGYNSSIIGKLSGYDFFTAKAYIGFKATRSINVEFGHSNHFIGNGHRSLLLTDYGANYLNLNIRTQFWKFHYQNIFAELSPSTAVRTGGQILLPKKYAAMHYLSFQPNHKFEIGIFESVIFARHDHFEFQYLNPVILYRAIEHTLNSPDNVLIGANMKWNPIKGISLYGQVLLDEFYLKEVRAQSGWWANKFGGQVGAKYINAFGVDHLDLQVEYNAVRPYTYGHRDTVPNSQGYTVSSYTNINQPLAHLLGANFREFIGILRYKPLNQLYIQAKLLNTIYGDDTQTSNWGNNILLPYTTIEREFGNVIGQGIKTRVNAINLDLSYEIRHNYFIDFRASYRTTKVDDKIFNQHLLGGGIRVNLANISYDY